MADIAGRIIRGLVGAPLDALATKMATDPRIQRKIAENLPALTQINPALAQRLQAGDPSASVEAYQMIVRAEGELPLRSSGPSRQLELPLGEQPDSSPMGLIPFGVRGPGVPVGGPTGPGVLVGEPIGSGVPVYPMSAFRGGMSVPQQGIPTPSGPARIGTTAWTPGSGQLPLRGVIPHPGMGGPRDLILRQPDQRSLSDMAQAGIAAAAAAGGGYMAGRSAYDLLPGNGPAVPSIEAATVADDAVTSGGTEDLAAETSPPPVVTPTTEEPAEPPLADVSVRPNAQPAGLPKRPGPDTGFIETNSAYALKPAQQRTLEALLDAGIEPSRAEAIARGQRSLTQAEERAIIANGPARRQRDMDMMEQRRRARMGAY